MRIAALFTSAAVPVEGASEIFLAGDAGVPLAWGGAVRHAATATDAELLVIDPPRGSLARFAAASSERALDVVVGRRRQVPLADRVLNRAARVVLVQPLDVGSGVLALRLAALREAMPTRDDDAAEAATLGALHGLGFRFGELALEGHTPPRSGRRHLALLAELTRQAAGGPPSEDAHEGYQTLRTLEAQAPNYTAWLARAFGPHLGRRVLEVGAGLGTITAHLAASAEHVTALEVEPFYVRRLRNRFRSETHVEVLHTDLSQADWQLLERRRFDTVVLSNVLEHLADDAEAVRTFARVLPPGGRLVVFVPARPELFGTLDEAVGHHRRYSAASLRGVLEGNGFSIDALNSMNLLGVPGWFLNARALGRRALPPLQVAVYDQLAPTLASLEAKRPLPLDWGLSLLAVASRTP